MMLQEELQEFEIPFLEGKVCYLDGTGGTPTVECYSRNIAFRFSATKLGTIKIGEWLCFRGIVKAGVKVLKNGEIKGFRPYIHEPMDNSPKSHWLFFELHEAEYRRIGPLGVIDALRNCSNTCRRFMDSWGANDNAKQLMELFGALTHARDVVQPVLRQKVIDEKERQAPMKAANFDLTLD